MFCSYPARVSARLKLDIIRERKKAEELALEALGRKAGEVPSSWHDFCGINGKNIWESIGKYGKFHEISINFP